MKQWPVLAAKKLLIPPDLERILGSTMTDTEMKRMLHELEGRLTERIDSTMAKFDDKLAKRSAHLERHFDAALTKQFVYTEKRLAAIEAKLDTKADKTQVDTLYNLVDGIAKRLMNDSDEQSIINSRHEGWIGQLAGKAGVKLVPEL